MGGDLTVGITQSLYKRTRGAAKMAAAEKKRAIEYGTKKELENPLNGFKKGPDGKYSKEDIATARRLAEQKLKKGEFFGASLKSKFGADKARRMKGYFGQGINKVGKLFGKENLIDLKGGKNDPSASARQRVRSAVGYESRFESSMAEAYKKDLENWNKRVQANKPPVPGEGGKGGGITRVEGIDELQSLLEETNRTASFIKKDTESLVGSFKKQTKVLSEIAKHFGVQLEMQEQAIEDAKIAAEQQSIASGADTSGFATPDRGLDGESKKSGGMLDKIGNFLGDALGSGFDPFNAGDGIDLPDGRRRGRRKGSRRRLMRRKVNRFGSRLKNRFKNPFRKPPGGPPRPPGGKGGGFLNLGKSISNRASDIFTKGRSTVGGLKRGAMSLGTRALGRGKSLLGSAKGGVMKAAGATKGWWDNIGTKIAGRVAFAGAKNAGKYAPGALSTGFYAADTADRLKRGDKFGAWLNAIGMGGDLAATGFAAASAGPQAVGTGPAAGIASIVSAIADSVNFGRDIFMGPGSQNERGGVVDGPDSGYPVKLHGTEAIIPLDNKFTRGEKPVTRGGNYERGNLMPSVMGIAQSKFEERQKADSLAKSFAKGFEKYQEKSPGGGIFGALFGSKGNPGFIQRLMGLKEIGDPNENPPPGPGNGGGGGGGGSLIQGDAPAEIKALMHTISGGEGGPNSVQGIGEVKGLSDMTIDQAIAKAKSYIGKGSSTGALGAFQFHSSYLRERAKNAGLDPGKDKFSLENQTKIMRHFMTQVYTAGGGKGGEAGLLKDLQGGKLESSVFPKLSKDLGWPSLPGGSQANVHTAGAGNRYQANLKRYQNAEAASKPAKPASAPAASGPAQNPVVSTLTSMTNTASRLLGLSQEDKNNKAKPTTVTLNNGQSTVNNTGGGDSNPVGSAIKSVYSTLDFYGNITGNLLSGGKK